jgi:outer membrane protein TolC
MTPREAVEAIDAFHGYAAVGLPFESGHVFALVLRPSTDGQAYVSVWHRDPNGRWTFYSTVPPDCSCARYFGARVHRNVVTPIGLEWTTSSTLLVRIGTALVWQMTLRSSPLARIFNTIAPLLPERMWRMAAVLRSVGLTIAAMFDTGRTNLTGRTPNGHRFVINPRQLWLIDASTAHVSGKNVGPPGPLKQQAALEDMRIPQRGLLAITSVHLDRRPHENLATSKYGKPCDEAREGHSTSSRWTRLAPLVFASLLSTLPVSAQSTLSLTEAIARARVSNPDVTAAAAAEREATERVRQTRGGYFPTVEVAESWQRGNHPVFLFSSLLAQRKLTASDFALEGLHHPVAADNFRTAVSLEQSLFDRSLTARVRASSIARDIATTGRRLVDQDLTSAVTDAFGRVLIAQATARSAAAMVETAKADRETAGNRRDAGRATDADVLQLDVYLARTLEQQVEAASDERIARARLNQLIGEPLSATFSLDFTPSAAGIDLAHPAALEEEALKNRPEVLLAIKQEQLSAVEVEEARAAFLPQVAVQATWELNGASWNSRASSWVAGGAARINLFHSLTDKARLAAAREQTTRRAIERRKAETMARLDVQTAIARLEAAKATEAVGRAAADQARESRRIVRDRYASGLTDAAMLLRSADAVLQADAQAIAARVNVITATANLQRAIGRPQQ